MRRYSSVVSLRASGGARTVLLAMAASQERAARIRDLKDVRPDLTWERIADYCEVKERSAIEWSRTGGITHENCVKLAKLFDVPDEWLWSGRERPIGTADLMGETHRVMAQRTLGGGLSIETRLDRIEASLNAIQAHLKITPSDDEESPSDVAATAARRRAKKQPPSAASRQPRKGKGQAA